MSWIKEIDEEDADGQLAEIYSDLIKKRGKVSNILKVHSLNPDAMKYHMDLYMSIVFRRGGLKRPESEMLATFVSSLNKCDYCVEHHAVPLKKYWKDDEKVEKLIEDYTKAGLNSRELAMIKYAEMLTLAPEKSCEAEIAALRDADLSEKEILDTALNVSYFNFVNRISLGLGVDYNEEEMNGYKD